MKHILSELFYTQNRTGSTLRYVFAFLKALCKHWWTLLSSAFFTILGIYILWSGKPNRWAFVASIALAGVLLLVAAFLAWKDEYVPNRGGPDILLEWKSHEHGQDTIRLRNVGLMTAFDVAMLDFSWNALQWHRTVTFPSIDPNQEKTCEAQFRRDITPHNGEIGYMFHIFMLSERPRDLSISVAFQNIHGIRFKRSFILDLVQSGENQGIRCKPGKLEVI